MNWSMLHVCVMTVNSKWIQNHIIQEGGYHIYMLGIIGLDDIAKCLSVIFSSVSELVESFLTWSEHCTRRKYETERKQQYSRGVSMITATRQKTIFWQSKSSWISSIFVKISWVPYRNVYKHPLIAGGQRIIHEWWSCQLVN